MSDNVTRRRFTHRKQRYTAVFRARPFREGREVTVAVGGHTIRVGELGLGERATIERLKHEIDELLNSTCSTSK